MKGNQAVGLKKNAIEPHPSFLSSLGFQRNMCLSRVLDYWEMTKFPEPRDPLSGCLSFSSPRPPGSFQALWECSSMSSTLQSNSSRHGDPGPACVNAPAWSQNAKPQKGYSSVPSTYHHLCSKHVLVPKLKVSHFLEDHLLVFPGLKEVCTSENCGVTRGFMPFNVNGVWLVIGINSPGRGGKRERERKAGVIIISMFNHWRHGGSAKHTIN